MAELWETDVRVFLTLTGLARRHTERLARVVGQDSFEDALAQAQKHFPDLTEEQLLELAKRVEKQRNEAICQIALRVPPLRKITSREAAPADQVRTTLECGHEKTFRAKDFQRMTRCRECLKVERTTVANNFRPVSKGE